MSTIADYAELIRNGAGRYPGGEYATTVSLIRPVLGDGFWAAGEEADRLEEVRRILTALDQVREERR